jgi:hypothetical protein
MPQPRRRRHGLQPDRRRALEGLASCPQEGCSEAVMRTHGFTTEQMVELTAAQRVAAGKHRLEAGTAGPGRGPAMSGWTSIRPRRPELLNCDQTTARPPVHFGTRNLVGDV